MSDSDSVGNLIGYQAAEVAGVIVHDTPLQGVVQHFFIDLIDASTDGLDQSATAYHGIEFQRNTCLFQFVEH